MATYSALSEGRASLRTVLLSSTAIAAMASSVDAQQAQKSQALPEVTVIQRGSVKAKKPGKPAAKSQAAQTAMPSSINAAAESVSEAPSSSVQPQAGIGVGTEGLSMPATTTVIGSAVIATETSATSNTADVLTKVPGVAMFQGGQVSGLPTINGLNDDRVKVILNGMIVTSACANHMNPPLSYTDPSQIAYAEVLTGVTPVSKGGDSLGGTVIVETALPHFASAGETVHAQGSLSGLYRSNSNGFGTSATASVATQSVGVSYAGAWARGENYDDGHGNEVKSSEYEAQNHAVKLAVRNGGDLFVVEGGLQSIPYQGFVNQRMDMVDNQAWNLNSRYVGRFGWGVLDARAFYQHVEHEMNFLDDKRYNKIPEREMPMLTEGEDVGYSIKAEVPLSDQDVLRIGNEFHHALLDDWWPATMTTVGMMGPNTYVTLNGATRDRVGTFVEWERKWDRVWTTLFGVRNDTVWMDTGNVQGYNNSPMSVYAADAAAFNAREHERTDSNFDATALARFEPSRSSIFEAGYAMKSRAPNLYERYAWSKKYDGTAMGTAQMAMNMIGWFGDGNGYTGNLDLESETAHTVSFTMGWHDDGARSDWNFKITPYYTYVEDYIGVRKIGNSVGHPGFVDLQFANHDAELYGVNFSGSLPLVASSQLGRFDLNGVAGYVHGENAETGVSLYHMMPLHGTLALTQTVGGWTNFIELALVGGKRNVDTVRNELETAGYALVNLGSRYEVGNWRFDLGVKNVFDTYFEDPLGGHYIEPTMPGHIGGVAAKDNVPGEGRSFNAGVSVKF